MNKPVIILGGGGHARVLIEALIMQGVNFIGITELKTVPENESIYGIPVIGDDSAVLKYPADEMRLVNGIGSTGRNKKRIQLFERFKEKGYSFYSVFHPSAVISPNAILEEGVQVMAGAVIQAGCKVGRNSIINTRASLDHDCVIGDHVHIAPGATVSGNVRIGTGSHIGAGAVLIQGVAVGENSVVGVGAVVIEDVPSSVMALGVPARVVKKW